MLQQTGSDATPLETADPPRQRMLARDGVTVSLEPGWRAGRKLESAREQLGLTIDQVAALTLVRREYLEALEEMNAKLLPGRAIKPARSTKSVLSCGRFPRNPKCGSRPPP